MSDPPRNLQTPFLVYDVERQSTSKTTTPLLNSQIRTMETNNNTPTSSHSNQLALRPMCSTPGPMAEREKPGESVTRGTALLQKGEDSSTLGLSSSINTSCDEGEIKLDEYLWDASLIDSKTVNGEVTDEVSSNAVNDGVEAPILPDINELYFRFRCNEVGFQLRQRLESTNDDFDGLQYWQISLPKSPASSESDPNKAEELNTCSDTNQTNSDSVSSPITNSVPLDDLEIQNNIIELFRECREDSSDEETETDDGFRYVGHNLSEFKPELLRIPPRKRPTTLDNFIENCKLVVFGMDVNLRMEQVKQRLQIPQEGIPFDAIGTSVCELKSIKIIRKTNFGRRLEARVDLYFKSPEQSTAAFDFFIKLHQRP